MTMKTHTMKRVFSGLFALGLGLGSLGCEDGPGAKDPSKVGGPVDNTGQVVDERAANDFKTALAEMDKLDKTAGGA